jgi:hypothetical protein
MDAIEVLEDKLHQRYRVVSDIIIFL